MFVPCKPVQFGLIFVGKPEKLPLKWSCSNIRLSKATTRKKFYVNGVNVIKLFPSSIRVEEITFISPWSVARFFSLVEYLRVRP